MGFLRNTDVGQCAALFGQGQITQINDVSGTVNISMSGISYANIPVHYHCMDSWKNESHPHSLDEVAQMLKAFSVGNNVLVMCDQDKKPLYVIGFTDGVKECAPNIVLFKMVAGVWDYWYYDLNAEQGFHQNPQVAAPTTPAIITKWFSCNGGKPVEYYTKTTPAFNIVTTGGCADTCGLINFIGSRCCDAGQGAADDDQSWYVCPCGGTGADIDYDPWTVCQETVSCPGGCNGGTQLLSHPGAKNTQNRTSNQSTNCPLGNSWGLALDNLVEKIDVGPRSRMAGDESKTIWTVVNSACGPYESIIQQAGVDFGDCTPTTDLGYWGSDCHSSPYCTGWINVGDPGGNSGQLWGFSGSGYQATYQGCVDFTEQVKSSNYFTEATPLITRVRVGTKETLFSGAWSLYLSGSGSQQSGTIRRGIPTPCLPCDNIGGSLGAPVLEASFSYSEESYGVAGWNTVVTSDGRFAVLMPMLTLQASAEAISGNTTGSVSSNTEALLRIVETNETNFDFGGEPNNYPLFFMPAGRDDLGISPNCWTENLPLPINLRAFHWHETFNWILVAFVIGGVYKAGLVKKVNNAWQLDGLTAFKAWVTGNSLQDYTAFLS